MSQPATQAPMIPPRPARSQDKSSMPTVPPRPVNRRLDRSSSPGRDRFAPSPLNEGSFLYKPPGVSLREPLPRSTSVDLPTLGEEGKEYAGLAERAACRASRSDDTASNPEHTRTVADDLKLHAPKPSLPAVSAKQQVLNVTRTSSERAASFGIGRSNSYDDAPISSRSLKKKASTTSQLSTSSSHVDDEHGIPEIGQQVPMYRGAGDVQAPSPAPGTEAWKPKNHHRKHSSRGSLPPGSYGLHGHGLAPQDKLEKAYFEKHPDLLKREHTPHHADRPNDFSLSKDDLNRIVRETASRGSGVAARNYSSTPSEAVGWQAIEETVSRVASPQVTPLAATLASDRDVIHVDEPNPRTSVLFGDDETAAIEVHAPILAEDEVAKDPSPGVHYPAVELGPERRGSAFEMDAPSSRPGSRPTSMYKEPAFEHRPTPLEDVEEYEPLFPEEEKHNSKPVSSESPRKEVKHRFPSQDVWEDVPNSVHYTAEVSTPELPQEWKKPVPTPAPHRDTETPAQAFARHQEELAEMEAREHGPDGFIPRHQQKSSWAKHQTHLVQETEPRPSMAQRFPSRDVWEDTPESLKLEAVVSMPEPESEASPSDAKDHRRASTEATSALLGDKPKPAMPERPKPKQFPSDDNSSKPAIPDRPKPQIPARPVKSGPTSRGLEPAETAAQPRAKPAVPVRPVGSKIAALQAGFMSDLNNRLKLGPQAPMKVEDVATGNGPVEEKEPLPLPDVRKGRARGPQRRAPAATSPGPAATASAASFTFSSITTLWQIDPENPDGWLVAAKSGDVPPTWTGRVENEDATPLHHATAETREEEEACKHKVHPESTTLASNMASEPVVVEHVEDDRAAKEETATPAEAIQT